MADVHGLPRAVLVAIFRLSGESYRDVGGRDLLAELARAGHTLSDAELRDVMVGLRDQEGLLTFSASGTRKAADTSLIRLEPAARQMVREWPEVGGSGLEPDQETLLIDLVEAARKVPRPEQLWHLGGEDEPNVLRGPWGTRTVLVTDLDALRNAGLLTATRLNYVYGSDYVISRDGYEYYAALKQREPEPAERQEVELRRFMESDAFREAYPTAYGKWADAERLLLAADSEAELTTIGHKVREATHEFGMALVEEHDPPDVDPDLTKVKNRIRSVIDHHRPALGQSRAAMLDALLTYWFCTVDLIQRQEHGRKLTWLDGRRVVFHTASLMFEIVATLEDLEPPPPAHLEGGLGPL